MVDSEAPLVAILIFYLRHYEVRYVDFQWIRTSFVFRAYWSPNLSCSRPNSRSLVLDLPHPFPSLLQDLSSPLIRFPKTLCILTHYFRTLGRHTLTSLRGDYPATHDYLHISNRSRSERMFSIHFSRVTNEMALTTSHCGPRPIRTEGLSYNSTCWDLPEFNWKLDYSSHIHMTDAGTSMHAYPLFDAQ